MKIIIEENSGCEETEIIIRCSHITEEIQEIASELRLKNRSLTGKKDGEIYIIGFSDILYFDTTDRKTFIYTENEIYETVLKLNRLEGITGFSSFMRVNKSCILNLKRVKRISGGLLPGKLIAHLDNDEKVEISRFYVPDLKKKLRIDEEWS